MNLFHGNCLDELRKLEANSIDSVVTDPPYGLSFMGKKWDYDVPSADVWREVLRVLKPGGHLLSFGGTRTYHRLVVNIEDAGFEIRDQLAWLYGQGFPKSQNVYKAAAKTGHVCECGVKSRLDEATKQAPECEVRSLRNQNVSQTFDSSAQRGEILQSCVSEQGSPHTVLRSEPEKSSTVGIECGLEGRSDVQAKQGELHRSEICPVSRNISRDGSQGRLHNGTSSCDGDVSRSHSPTSGSRAPHRSQHSEQSYLQPGTISEQPRTQTCGGCGKAIIDPGLGTALKPAIEPIVLARKPLEDKLTVAANVMRHGTGGLNIDASRIEFQNEKDLKSATFGSQPKITSKGAGSAGGSFQGYTQGVNATNVEANPQGRWPANVLLDEEAAVVLDEQSGMLKSGKLSPKHVINARVNVAKGAEAERHREQEFGGDSGGASRFFYVAKASKRERNAGLEGMPFVHRSNGNKWTDQDYRVSRGERPQSAESGPRQNHHPTVKPVKLMEYLITLVTPPGGTVLDPFMGSGTTGVAAKQLGFKFIGIEMNQEYLSIARKRIEKAKECA